jgi:hypothetical protein
VGAEHPLPPVGLGRKQRIIKTVHSEDQTALKTVCRLAHRRQPKVQGDCGAVVVPQGCGLQSSSIPLAAAAVAIASPSPLAVAKNTAKPLTPHVSDHHGLMAAQAASLPLQ